MKNKKTLFDAKLNNLAKPNDNIKFVPEAELLGFAESFSKHYQNMRADYYWSKNGKYCIHYFDNKKDKLGRPIEEIVSITESGLIQFNRTRLLSLKITPDYIFHCILWCWARLIFNDDIYSICRKTAIPLGSRM